MFCTTHTHAHTGLQSHSYPLLPPSSSCSILFSPQLHPEAFVPSPLLDIHSGGSFSLHWNTRGQVVSVFLCVCVVCFFFCLSVHVRKECVCVSALGYSCRSEVLSCVSTYFCMCVRELHEFELKLEGKESFLYFFYFHFFKGSFTPSLRSFK